MEESAGQARVLAGSLSALPISPAGTAFPSNPFEETIARIMPACEAACSDWCFESCARTPRSLHSIVAADG